MTDISKPPLPPQPGNGKTYAVIAANCITIIVVWLWNTFVPAHPMPAEVSGALQALITILAVIYAPHGGQ